jgi:hypothetical protein
MIKIQAISQHARIHLFLLFTFFLLIAIPVLNKTPTHQVTEQSSSAAAQFLFLVDTEEYARSWEVTSENLKQMLTQKAWNEQITKLRSFLGPIIERIYHDISYTNSAADVPPGEYVVMTFISKFEFRDRVTETITLMLGDNNQWQVAGYYLK